MNLSLVTKNHACDPKIEFVTKSISKPYGRATAMPPAWELILKILTAYICKVIKILSIYKRIKRHQFQQVGNSRRNPYEWMKRSGQPETHGKFDHVQFNSNAVGMAVARLYGSKIDFTRNPISGSAARFFVNILKFIFTYIYEIKISKKKFLTPK